MASKWLDRQGFIYNKPLSIQHKFIEEKKKQFIEYYQELKVNAGDEFILFLDAVHTA